MVEVNSTSGRVPPSESVVSCPKAGEREATCGHLGFQSLSFMRRAKKHISTRCPSKPQNEHRTVLACPRVPEKGKLDLAITASNLVSLMTADSLTNLETGATSLTTHIDFCLELNTNSPDGCFREEDVCLNKTQCCSRWPIHLHFLHQSPIKQSLTRCPLPRHLEHCFF